MPEALFDGAKAGVVFTARENEALIRQARHSSTVATSTERIYARAGAGRNGAA